MPKTGVEPACLSTVHFEYTVYAIPPLWRVRRGLINRTSPQGQFWTFTPDYLRIASSSLLTANLLDCSLLGIRTLNLMDLNHAPLPVGPVSQARIFYTAAVYAGFILRLAVLVLRRVTGASVPFTPPL